MAKFFSTRRFRLWHKAVRKMPLEFVLSPPLARASDPAPRRNVRRVIWSRLQPHWPAALVSAVLGTMILVFVRHSIAINDGRLIYPLDDAYGHMAIARNLAQHGIWGFSPINGFSSGGSSLVWPLLLAGCFNIFGLCDWPPLALNVVAAIAFLFYAGSVIRRHTHSGLASALILLAVMYFSPLPTMVGAGMEHCVQILVCVVFVDLAARALADGETPDSVTRARTWLPFWAFGMTMVRYEGLFLLGIVGLLLLCRRQWRTAILCGAAGGLPVTVFGLYARHKGWHFLPNSLLLKAGVTPFASLDDFTAFVTKWYAAMIVNPHMYILLIGLVSALLVQRRRYATLWNRPALLLTILLGGTLLHLQFAGLGWFYRYESYLLGLGILAVSLALVDEAQAVLASPRPLFERGLNLGLLALAALFFCAPLWSRAQDAWNQLGPASHDIYEQQFQMARLVRQSYRNKGVAANDIGAINFFNDIDLVDLWGLGTLEVADARRTNTYTRDTVRGLLKKHDVQVIMVYEPWSILYGGLPPEWVPVGQWTIPDNVVCGFSTVTFFAPDATRVPRLAEALREYCPHLPPSVGQAGFYRGDALPHVQGAYAPEKDRGGTFYWTGQDVQFALYPSNDRDDAADVDAILKLNARVLSKGVTLDLTYDGQRIASRPIEVDEVGKWVDWPVKVHWREGFNTVNLTARGGKPVTSDADPRKLLLAVHEPRWTFADAPGVEYPAATPPVDDLKK